MLGDTLLLFATSVAVLLVALACHLITRCLNPRYLSISGFYYIMLMVIFAASLVIFPTLPSRVSEPFILVVSLGCVGTGLGILVAAVSWKLRRSETRNFYNAPVVLSVVDRRRWPGVWVLILFAVGLLGLYIITTPAIPLFYLLTGGTDSLELAVMREESFKLRRGFAVYLFQWNRALFFPYLAMLTYAYSRLYPKLSTKLLFIVVLPLALFNNALSTAEAPVAEVLLGVFLTHYLIEKGRISVRLVLLAFLVVFAYSIILPVVVDQVPLAQVPAVALSTYVKILNRFTLETAERISWYVDLFPRTHDFLGGTSMRPIALLTGQGHFNLPNYVFRQAFPARLSTGHANAPFIAHLYANWGFLGVLVGSFLIGWSLESLQVYLVRSKKTIWTLVAYAFSILVWRKLLSTEPTTVLISHGALLVFFLPSLVALVSSLLVAPGRRVLGMGVNGSRAKAPS